MGLGVRALRLGYACCRWVVAPMFCGVIFYGAALNIGPSVNTLRGHGVPGSFTATEKDCVAPYGGCSWRGVFRSDDGARVLTDVELGSGRGPERAGDSVPALYTGDKYTVYPRGWSWDWLMYGFVVVLSGGCFIGWIVSAVRRIRTRAATSRTDQPSATG